MRECIGPVIFWRLPHIHGIAESFQGEFLQIIEILGNLDMKIYILVSPTAHLRGTYESVIDQTDFHILQSRGKVVQKSALYGGNRDGTAQNKSRKINIQIRVQMKSLPAESWCSPL